MKRLTPRRLLDACLIVVLVGLVLPMYAMRGLNDSLDHARGTGTVGGIDFKAYYIAADMLRSGRDFYDIDQQLEETLARGLPANESFYIYPPLLAILFVPLTFLPMETAAQVWFFLNLALYGACLALISRVLFQGNRGVSLPLLWILAFLFPPALFTLYKGQVNIVVLLLLSITFWLCLRDRQVPAGVAVAVASLIKMVPVLFLPYFLWKRKYALILSAVASMALISVLSLVIVGPGPHRTFVFQVLPRLAQPRPNPGNQSLGGFLSLLLIENDYSSNLIHSPLLWRILTLAASAALVLGVVVLLWRRRAATEGANLEFALVVATIPLVTNIAWTDLFVLLVLPYAILYRYASRRRMRTAWVIAGAASVLCISFPRFQDFFTILAPSSVSLLHNPVVIGLPLCGLIVLWMVIAATLSQSPDRESLHAAA